MLKWDLILSGPLHQPSLFNLDLVENYKLKPPGTRDPACHLVLLVNTWPQLSLVSYYVVLYSSIICLFGGGDYLLPIVYVLPFENEMPAPIQFATEYETNQTIEGGIAK